MGLAKDHEEERGRRKKGQVTMGVTRRHGVELLAPRTGLVEQKQPKRTCASIMGILDRKQTDKIA